MDQRIYHGNIDPNVLADHLVGVFNQHVNQGMYYSHHHTMAQRAGEGDQVLVQIMRAGSWGRNGGTLGVSLARVPGGISISLGQSNWLDMDESTLAGMVIGALVFPPLLLLPLLSGLSRSTFDQDVWDVIDNYCAWIRSRSDSPPPRQFRCPYCGAYNQQEAPECLGCHMPLHQQQASQQNVSPEQAQPSQSSASSEPAAGQASVQETPSVSEPGVEKVLCPQCGTRVTAGNFCGNCAAPLRESLHE